MIGSNQKKIPQKKIKNKIGGGSNESRFWTTDKELRTRKEIIVPSAGINGYIKLEQAFNSASKKKDVVKVGLFVKGKKIGHAIVTREELEQGIAIMAQGAETLKYTAPTPYEDDKKVAEKKSRLIN